MYLSYKLLLNLSLLSKKFPSPDGTQNNSGMNRLNVTPAPLSTNANPFINNGCEGLQTSSHAACSCPQWTAPPLRPAELPFPCIPENNKPENLAPQEIRIINLQYLPSPGIAMHGWPTYRKTCGPHCHTKGIAYSSNHTHPLAKESVWGPPLRWSAWSSWMHSIWRTNDMVPPCGGQQETQLFSPLDSGPLLSQ